MYYISALLTLHDGYLQVLGIVRNHDIGRFIPSVITVN